MLCQQWRRVNGGIRRWVWIRSISAATMVKLEMSSGLSSVEITSKGRTKGMGEEKQRSEDDEGC